MICPAQTSIFDPVICYVTLSTTFSLLGIGFLLGSVISWFLKPPPEKFDPRSLDEEK